VRRLACILIKGLRHAAVGVAIVAVLMTLFQVHVHHQQADGHVHTDGLSMSCAFDDVPADPAMPQPTDGDGCGCCSCPPTHALAVDSERIPLHATVEIIEPISHTIVVPDSLSYPPDPPPAQLS